MNRERWLSTDMDHAFCAFLDYLQDNMLPEGKTINDAPVGFMVCLAILFCLMVLIVMPVYAVETIYLRFLGMYCFCKGHAVCEWRGNLMSTATWDVQEKRYCCRCDKVFYDNKKEFYHL